MRDEELDALQREMGLGIPARYIRDVLSAMGSEGEGLTLREVRAVVALWAEFSEDYCASWLIAEGLMGNFAGWMIRKRVNA